jgi:hypothetical protein
MPVSQYLRNFQGRGALTAAFTNEKWKMTIKKTLLRHWQLIPNFFTCQSWYDVKPKSQW